MKSHNSNIQEHQKTVNKHNANIQKHQERVNEHQENVQRHESEKMKQTALYKAQMNDLENRNNEFEVTFAIAK